MAGSRRDLLENKVVLIVPAGSDKGISSFEDVASDKVGMVAIGEIASVPVGQYTEEIFTNMGLWDEIQANKTINYGADVTQVLTWVESGEVDCGIVYATDAATSDKVTVVATAPADSHSPVIYPVSVLARTEYPAEAQAFVDFLFTPEASAVFEQYGFTTGL